MKLKLYLVSQDINNDWDTYDSIVVCAKNEKDARLVKEFDTEYSYGEWITQKDIDKLNVKFIGYAGKGIERGIILASYNAG